MTESNLRCQNDLQANEGSIEVVRDLRFKNLSYALKAGMDGAAVGLVDFYNLGRVFPGMDQLMTKHYPPGVSS